MAWSFLQQASAAYGTPERVLEEVHQRENSGRLDFTVNTWDSNAAKGTPSAGPFQFIKPTFNDYARKARAANPNAWRGIPLDWRNPKAQALAASWAMANGHGSAWSTYQKAVAAAGQTPSQTPTAAVSGASSGSGDTGLAARRAVYRSVFKMNPAVGRILEQADEAGARAAQQATTTTSSSPAPAAQTKGGPGHDYKSLFRWANRNFGALLDNMDLDDPNNRQTIGGTHAAEGNHPRHKAVDLGDAKNDRARLNQIAAYARAHPQYFSELYFNPLGWGIKNGKIIKGLTVDGHDNHMHLAVF